MSQHTVTLQILSDLHLGNTPFEHPRTDADIVVLAGDISRPLQAVNWAKGFAQPVIYVAGNHEFYGSSVAQGLHDLRRHTSATNIHFLEKEERILKGIRFLGTTLWSDFNLFGSQEKREQAIAAALPFIRDFSVIHSDASPGQPFTPDDMEALFSGNRAWLAAKLKEPFDGPTVVITHHAPSCQSIHPRFQDSLVNACFVSDSEQLMNGDTAELWIHGHTHDSFDYTVNGTRVVCNPRGYVRDGITENALFDPHMTITLPVQGAG
jgi:hypothetical protein